MSGQANLKLPSGGSITIAGQDSASNFTATLPANNGTVLTTASTAVVTQAMLGAGVAGNGPAFRAYKATNQVVSDAVTTKITFPTKTFDTANAYDAANSRFQPTVAGYYQIAGNIYGSSTSSLSYSYIQIFKNGVQNSGVVAAPYLGATSMGLVTTLTYLNGSTDYIEIYAALSGVGTLNALAGDTLTFFSAFLARSA